MKKIFLLFCLFLTIAMTPPAQQSKRVYITLDVSGSMWSDKYVLANYTSQMIVTLCDDDDEVYMIVYGKEKCLSKEKNPLTVIQKPVEDLKFGTFRGESQMQDIQGFNSIYSPSKDKQDWLFIIGDGYWGTPNYGKDCEKFQKIVKDGTLNICYLQTCEELGEHTDFTQFAEDLGVVDIGKSDINPNTIKKGCDHFAKKILGFSDVSLKKKEEGSQCFSFKAELPISEFIIVYQDQVEPGALPNISSVTVNGQSLSVKLKGTPTTVPVKSEPNQVTLSGNVWRVKAGSPIPANTEVKVCFDKPISKDNASIYPLVQNVEFGGTCFTASNDKLKKLNDHTFSICREENKAKVRVELSEESKENLPKSLLKKTKVVVKANNKEYPATYKDGGFECEIELLDEETQYYAECDCPGHCKRVTPTTTIKKGDCAPTTYIVDEHPTKTLPSVTFERLKHDPIKISLADLDTVERLDRDKYDFQVEVEDGYLYEEPQIHFEGDEMVITVKPKGTWCECLTPDKVKVRVVATPKDGAFEDVNKQYTQKTYPLQMALEKRSLWLSRCMWAVLALGGMFLLFIYILLLLKKRRFKKNAAIRAIPKNKAGDDDMDNSVGHELRKDGFSAWFGRWFVPRTEKNTLDFFKPDITVTFMATESGNVVEVPKSSIDTVRMTIDGYDLEDLPVKKNPRLGTNGRIGVEKKGGNFNGSLRFEPGEKTDGGGFRFFLSILLMVDILAFLALIALVIKVLL